MANVHITLNPLLLEYTSKKVKSGGYSSKSEIINEALRQMMEKDLYLNLQIERLQKELEKGEKSGYSELDLDNIFDKAKAKFKKTS